jgi:hypothetical protein
LTESSSPIPSTAQFGRAYNLAVANDANALDLSSLHFTFQVKSADLESPNTCVVRAYNAAPSTVDRLKSKEFTQLMLQAGYQNNVNFGIIFKGDIKRVKSGREKNTDSFVEIMAADGDLLYNFGLVNTSVGPGSDPQTRLKAIVTHLGAQIDQNANEVVAAAGGILPRGAVLFGLGRDLLRNLANNAGARWSIQQGVITFIKNTGYLPGEAVVLNSQSGLIGTPEATDVGINARMLLNAKLRIGGLVQINQALINQTLVNKPGLKNDGGLYFPAQTTADGFYRVLYIEHAGDTRANQWYSDIICLNVDLSALDGDQVQAYPAG